MTEFINNLIFPSVVSTVKIEEEMSYFLEKVKQFEFVRLHPDLNEQNYMYSTDNLNILDSIPELKKILLKYFTEYKNNILKVPEINFDITTSWSMKICKNSYSHVHNHSNSFYSGVLYLTDHPSDSCGELVFYDFNIIPKQILVVSEDPDSFLNDMWSISPEKNMLIFFPSYLMHRVSVHYDENPRYSIAFNIIPVDKYGRGDSSVNIKNIR
jgi:hypothetical protein